MAIYPLDQDQTIAQMWSNGVRGGGQEQRHKKLKDMPITSSTLV